MFPPNPDADPCPERAAGHARPDQRELGALVGLQERLPMAE
jgi:hypothetical protein